jgi:plasmid maintenance system killer protein
MQQRDVDLVKPRDQKTDMWHMLALQQSMQDKKVDQAMLQYQTR